MSPPWQVTTSIFDLPNSSLCVEISKYVPADTSFSDLRSNAQILFLAHGLTFVKELWEPMISRLFELDSISSIQEIWTMDYPNHGRSASLNDDEVLMSFSHYAGAILAFVNSTLIFLRSNTKINVVSHSYGGAALLLAQARATRALYHSLILLEPPMVLAEMSSLDEASAYFGKNLPWSDWDPRVRNLYLKGALRQIPCNRMVLSLTANQEISAASREAWIQGHGFSLFLVQIESHASACNCRRDTYSFASLSLL
ncbi:Alpha/beta hydrolase family-domain-containing protein [Mycena floridula]|nr:Alpha/beta hydrolase family-domain-containing protein [Mycena floridula]